MCVPEGPPESAVSAGLRDPHAHAHSGSVHVELPKCAFRQDCPRRTSALPGRKNEKKKEADNLTVEGRRPNDAPGRMLSTKTPPPKCRVRPHRSLFRASALGATCFGNVIADVTPVHLSSGSTVCATSFPRRQGLVRNGHHYIPTRWRHHSCCSHHSSLIPAPPP